MEQPKAEEGNGRLAGWLAGCAAQPLLFVAPRGPRCLRAPRLLPYPRPTDVSLYDAGIVGSMLAYPCNKTTWGEEIRLLPLSVVVCSDGWG